MLLREKPPIDRPRERLTACGPTALPDQDLLSILLGSGIRGRDVCRVASELLDYLNSAWPNIDLDELKKIPGIGPARATVILSAIEFGRRRFVPIGTKITSAQDIFNLMRHIADRKQEHFVCLSLNGAHEVIENRVITIGLVNSTQIHPREVYSDPIKDRACAVVVAHNHPSGNVSPSVEDKRVTDRIKNAGKILGIELLDHVIFSRTDYYSFADEGWPCG